MSRTRQIGTRTNVKAAFQTLLQEIENLHEHLSSQQSGFAKNGEYEKAQVLLNEMKVLHDSKEKVDELSKSWRITTDEKVADSTENVVLDLKTEDDKGKALDQYNCRIPILQTIVELGGKAKLNEIVRLIEEKLKPLLTAADYKLNKDKKPKWQKAANWCGHSLKKQGLLNPDAKRGIWEITEIGKEELLKASNTQ